MEKLLHHDLRVYFYETKKTAKKEVSGNKTCIILFPETLVNYGENDIDSHLYRKPSFAWAAAMQGVWPNETTTGTGVRNQGPHVKTH